MIKLFKRQGDSWRPLGEFEGWTALHAARPEIALKGWRDFKVEMPERKPETESTTRNRAIEDYWSFTNGCLTIDLHGYHPSDIVLETIVRQAWEMGALELKLIHGHGRNRGTSPGFVNTNTGYFGLTIRRDFRHDKPLRRWIKHTTLYCGDMGCTSVKLKTNPTPTRQEIDCLPLRTWRR